MRCRIIAVGKCREAWLREAVAEYSKRLGKYATLEIVEVPDAPDHWPRDKALEQEAQALLAKVKDRDYVILADLHGTQFDSETFARKQQAWFEAGGAQLTWMIAGSNGFAPSVLERAQQRVCLSSLTFPHTLTRLILLEQIFRAFKIQAGETYHK